MPYNVRSIDTASMDSESYQLKNIMDCLYSNLHYHEKKSEVIITGKPTGEKDSHSLKSNNPIEINKGW